MATLIRMPEVAAGATEIVLSKWQVEVGTSVKVGDILAEMETEAPLAKPIAQSSARAAPAQSWPEANEHTVDIHFVMNEVLTAVIKADRSVDFEVKGELKATLLHPRAGHAVVQTDYPSGTQYMFKVNPHFSDELLRSDKQLRFRDAMRTFPINSPLGILRWRLHSNDASAIPLSGLLATLCVRLPVAVSCFANKSSSLFQKSTQVSIKCVKQTIVDLKSVELAIPLK
jgi:hypothetical protein